MVAGGLWQQQQASAAPSALRPPPLNHRPGLAKELRSQGMRTSEEV